MERGEFGDRMYTAKPFKGSTAKLPKKKSEGLAQERRNFGKERASNRFQAGVLDDSSFYGDALYCNGAEGGGFLSHESRVSINLDFKSKKEISELKNRFLSELLLVRSLIKRAEQYSGTKLPVDNGERGRRLKRVHSEVGSSVDGLTDKVVRGTRTPVVAQFQKSSDVTPSEEKVRLLNQSKKPKANGKKSREDSLSVNGMQNTSSKVFKSCSSLLTKLMKCKGGWVFNTPVDAKRLGLVDYFSIIKDPMDLGTVKTRLSMNRYRTPEEFAEDVRLTFHNAMTYNMEGHEINTLAKQFLQMFEDRWVGIEADYLGQFHAAANLQAVHPTPARTRPPVTAPLQAPPVTTPSQPPPLTPPLLPPPTDISVIVDGSEAVTNDAEGPDAKSTNFMASGKSRLPKPKAKDLHKRDMTLEEKQKLSLGLQNLPAEKMEGVLRIIKKRNPSLYQDDDEIEVDIDTVDTETLWELDRFVIYYKKALSKMKRSALLGQIGVVGEPNLHEKSEVDGGMELAKENEAGEEKMFSSSSNEGASDSDGSSSSSSDSGSSSSDSDTDSSSS